MQTETDLMDSVEVIICEECGQSITVEYRGNEKETIECSCCGSFINIVWNW